MQRYSSKIFQDPKLLEAVNNFYDQIKMKYSQETLDLVNQMKPDKYLVLDTISYILYKVKDKKFTNETEETNGLAVVEILANYLAEI